MIYTTSSIYFFLKNLIDFWAIPFSQKPYSVFEKYKSSNRSFPRNSPINFMKMRKQTNYWSIEKLGQQTTEGAILDVTIKTIAQTWLHGSSH